MRRRHRALADRRPFARGEVAFEAIEVAIEDSPLSFVQRHQRVTVPELGLVQDAGAGAFGFIERLGEAFDKPEQAGGDVEVALLRAFERAVVAGAVAADLTRKAVEPLRGIFRACQAHVGKRARDPAIAVLERVNGHEPKVSDRRVQNTVHRRRLVEPCQEGLHLRFDPCGRRSLIMHPLKADGTGNDLHRAMGIVPPCADLDGEETGTPGRK